MTNVHILILTICRGTSLQLNVHFHTTPPEPILILFDETAFHNHSPAQDFSMGHCVTCHSLMEIIIPSCFMLTILNRQGNIDYNTDLTES